MLSVAALQPSKIYLNADDTTHILTDYEEVYYSHNGAFWEEQERNPSWSRIAWVKGGGWWLWFLLLLGSGAKVRIPVYGLDSHDLNFPTESKGRKPELFDLSKTRWVLNPVSSQTSKMNSDSLLNLFTFRFSVVQ